MVLEQERRCYAYEILEHFVGVGVGVGVGVERIGASGSCNDTTIVCAIDTSREKKNHSHLVTTAFPIRAFAIRICIRLSDYLPTLGT